MRHALLLSLLMLGACVPAPRATPQEDEQSKRFEPAPFDRAVLYIHRNSDFASFWESEVSVIGGGGSSIHLPLPRDAFVRVEREPGPIEVSCMTSSLADRELTVVRAGQIRYFNVSLHVGAGSPYCLVREVAPEAGQAIVRAGRQVKPI